MNFLLFKQILTRIFLNSSLCTIAFSHPCCALCNSLFGTFVSTMLLLANAVLRQFLVCNNILCVTKNYSLVFSSTFSKYFSLLSILLLDLFACSTAFHHFSSFFQLFFFLGFLNNLSASSSFFKLM